MYALEGVTVVALEQAVAMPFATRQLADLGARVLKVERPDVGDFARGYDRTVLGQSSYFIWLNRNKESVALDLKDPADRDLLKAMVAKADVFVENLAPGSVERLGFGSEELRKDNPRLITCSVSGYGQGGPYGAKKAYDLLVQCESGLLSLTGTPEEAVKVGISVADIAAGMYAYSGILTALLKRERTGLGSTLQVGMLDALGEWMSQPTLFSVYGGTEPPRVSASHASIAPYGPHRTGDDNTVFLGIQNEREWAKFCGEVLGRPELTDDDRFSTNSDRVRHRAELTAIIEAAFSGMTVGQAVSLLDEVGIATAQVRSPFEFRDHPQLEARGRWSSVATPRGDVECLLPPVICVGDEVALGPVPSLGQHTDSIRAEFAGRHGATA